MRRLEVIEGLSVNYDTILYTDLDTDKVLPYRLSDRIAHQFNYEHKPCEFLRFVSGYVNAWVYPDDRQRVLNAVLPDYIREKLADNKVYYVNYRIFSENSLQFLQLRVINVGDENHISQVVMGCRRIDEEILREMEQKQLLEDNEINLEIETEILQGIGFIIETASDGSIAVDKLKHAAPGYFSMVLIDIQMPVMNGYEASRAIRKLEDPALAQIPIIALSANAFESDKRISLESGMNEHLTKPIDVPLLLNTISHIFSGAGS